MKEKGKSNYSVMLEPPEVKHAMEVAKNQSTVSLPPFSVNLVANSAGKNPSSWSSEFPPYSGVILKDKCTNIYKYKIALK